MHLVVVIITIIIIIIIIIIIMSKILRAIILMIYKGVSCKSFLLGSEGGSCYISSKSLLFWVPLIQIND